MNPHSPASCAFSTALFAASLYRIVIPRRDWFTVENMREMFQHRGMRLIFTANLISMIGSGMNSAAVIWYILQATHSEVSLAALIALQTLPSMLLLPFTGVLIDREDRRHLMLWLDSARGAIIFFVAMLVFTHHVRLWHLYAMNVLVAIGF